MYDIKETTLNDRLSGVSVGEVCGVIEAGDQQSRVCLNTYLLVFDAVAWAASCATSYRANSVNGEFSQEDQSSFASMADGVEAWGNTPTQSRKELSMAVQMAIGVRSAFFPHEVRDATDLTAYSAAILRGAKVLDSRSEFESSFLLRINDTNADFYTVDTPALRTPRRFVGSYVQLHIVNQSDLIALIAR